MATSVYCLARNYLETDRIVDRLRAAGFSSDAVSVLFPDDTTSKDFAHEKHTKAPEGTAVGAGTGGVLGGALGWLVGAGTLAIPGIGPFIAAGPIMAALSGAAIGAAVGGIGGALIGLGIPEYEAKRYEGKIREGRVLISVHVANSEQESKAKEIFKREGATDIASSSEASVGSKK